MGRKINPVGFRLGINHNWRSNWFADSNNFSNFLYEDSKIRKYLNKKLSNASVSFIKINRSANQVEIIISTSRPGIIIGRSGAGVEEIKNEIEKIIKNKKTIVKINIQEVSNPDSCSSLVTQNISIQVEKRISWKRAVKQAIDRAKKDDVGGIKIMISGRLGGIEMARSEVFSYGKMPLQSLNANIEYAFNEAHTTYGVIGIKVWIYKKMIENYYNKGEEK